MFLYQRRPPLPLPLFDFFPIWRAPTRGTALQKLLVLAHFRLRDPHLITSQTFISVSPLSTPPLSFSPAIPPPQPIPGAKPRRRGADRPMGPGRRGQHQEDVERDDILAQKVSIYGWVKEEHLDIPPVGDSGKRFLILAQQGKSGV